MTASHKRKFFKVEVKVREFFRRARGLVRLKIIDEEGQPRKHYLTVMH